MALVTGAAGFIGSHLVEYLLATDWRVRGLDDFSTGSPANLDQVTSSPFLELIEGSMLDPRLVTAATADVTHVFHLAGRLGATYVERHPERTVFDTVEATRNILAAVSGDRIPLFFASTSEVYGDTGRQPLSEEADIRLPPPSNPRSSYVLGKAVGEMLINSYMRRGGGHAVIGRLFNTAGPRQSGEFGQVVPRFVESALAERPIVVHGDGKQTRAFTFVGDSVQAVVAALLKPEAAGETINIGSRQETSIIELAHLVMRLTGSSSHIVHVPYDTVHGAGARDIRRRVPDTSRLHRLVGYDCSTSLESIVASIVANDRAQRQPVAGTQRLMRLAPLTNITVRSPPR